MSAATQLKLVYLSHFSSPAGDRPVFKAIRENRISRIVECGIGMTQRSLRMIEAVRLANPEGDIHFTGIDLFEARCSCDGPGVSLKMAHRRLSAGGAKVQLVPGDPLSALARTANTLKNIDLLVISLCSNQAAIDAAWFFIPRILNENAVVLEEERVGGGGYVLKPVAHEEIARRAGLARRKVAA